MNIVIFDESLEDGENSIILMTSKDKIFGVQSSVNVKYDESVPKCNDISDVHIKEGSGKSMTVAFTLTKECPYYKTAWFPAAIAGGAALVFIPVFILLALKVRCVRKSVLPFRKRR